MVTELLHINQRTTVFLHFFDVHFLELKRAHLNKKEVGKEALVASKIALLYGNEILVPAASYFETRLCRKIISDLRSLFDLGIIWLVGAAANIEEFIFNKLAQYDTESLQYQEYSSVNLNGLPPFRTRYHSATKDIKIDWIRRLDEKNSVAKIAEGSKFELPKDFERRWEKVPDDLEGKAFVVPYVAPLLFNECHHPTIINRLNYVINEAYFSSYVNEFRACTVCDLIYLASPHPVPSHGPSVPFRKLIFEARKSGILNDIVHCKSDALLSLKDDERWVKCVVQAMHHYAQVEQSSGIRPTNKENKMDSLRSFIVHGHDDAAKLELKDYLQNTMKLPEPVILHQQPNKGRTVIEKFEECSKDIDVAFVLLTPADIGGIPKEEQRERARQNVIFELGVFVGRFGRKSGRVILLHKGDLEIPSDLDGVVYIDISNGIESAGENIRKELTELNRL